MDLKSGYPFWAIKNGLMYAFPRLERDVSCDVLIIGAGITGALIARTLISEGLDVVVVEQRDVAWGSTAASTALLQYEIDTHMTDLAQQYGEPAAAQVYLASVEAISTLQHIAVDVRDVDFRMKTSLYIASSRFHERRMRAEFEMREKHGLPVNWLSRRDVREQFCIDAPCAILSDVAAEVDPYRMASRLLHAIAKNGARIFDRTSVETLNVGTRSVHARTNDGIAIAAKHVVVAAGYAAQKWIREKVAANRSSYAFVTDPIDRDQLGPWSRALLWESARPYIYVRTTQDHRMVVGGEDDTIDIPARRDARVQKKAKKLMRRAMKLFPAIAPAPAFAWGGTFAETPDGLPYFGAHPQWGNRVSFAMAYGGNGVTYSALGGDLIAAAIQRRKHPLAKIFSFARRARAN